MAATRRTSKTAAAAEFSEAEMTYVTKYPAHRFVPGTLSAPGAQTVFDKKRVITIQCIACDAERTIATSDIFHCDKCVDCTKQARKDAMKAKRAATTKPVKAKKPTTKAAIAAKVKKQLDNADAIVVVKKVRKARVKKSEPTTAA